MLRVGVVGISGYSGELTLNLLLRHPQVRVVHVSANTTQGPLEKIYPYLKGKTNLVCEPFNLKKAIADAELFFLAVPHTTAMEIVPKLLKNGKRVIDLSGDYRLSNPQVYARWYEKKHIDPLNLKRAVYGLPEIYREKIKKAELVANPGCYPTAAILGLAPLAIAKFKSIQSIIIDAKSGVTGAGRKVTMGFMFSEVDENLKAYKVFNHQHTPEIENYLSRLAGQAVKVNFVPHLIPMNRGILETIYVQFDKVQSADRIYDLYKKFYRKEEFVRLLDLGQQPETRHVTGRNDCAIGLSLGDDGKLLVIVSVIDNLMKGAAGQAVQNMNIMCGFKENTGLL